MALRDSNGPERLWTAEDVAVFLGIHVRTVYAKANSGEIPSSRWGLDVAFGARTSKTGSTRRPLRLSECPPWLGTATPLRRPVWERSEGRTASRDGSVRP